MKKFITRGIAIAIICTIIAVFACGCAEAAKDEPTVADIAAAWFQENYPDEVYDEIVIDGYKDMYYGDRLTHVCYKYEGEVIQSTYLNVDWYREYAFK